MPPRTDSERSALEPGEIVYDRRARPVGRITGTTDDGFAVEAVPVDGDESEELPGQEFGEGYLMWRCSECGEMGELDDGMPEACPNCDVEKEALSEVLED
ncbi:MAG: DUF7130 family rubredoxin-like protein [Halanaeroarchaeum sp.]